MSDSDPSPEQMVVGVRYGNRVLVPSNQLLDPAGERLEFAGRPVDMALSPSGDVLAVLLPQGIQVLTPDGQLLRTISTGTTSLPGLAFTPDGEWLVASTLAFSLGSVAIGDVKGIHGREYMRAPANSVPAGLVFDGKGDNLYVALSRRNTVGRLDMRLGRVVAEADVGISPQGLAISANRERLYVTNWGGRRPQNDERVAESSGTPTLVDERGVASSGTVSVIDLASFQTIAEIPVGLHPGAIRVSPDGRWAAVANGNSDSVSLIDTASLQVAETISIPAWPTGYLGSSPTALAFGSDGHWLYVACGGINAVAVLERDADTYRLRGYVPTDWYPVAIAVRTDGAGDTIYVANSKGVGARPASNIRNGIGTVNVFQARDVQENWQRAVVFSNDPFQQAVPPEDSPSNLGDLGIKHVFLIIKENRTYDQVFGDLDRGNGARSLAIYGQEVTPNHHELARQFITFDNFYASGTVSADGHQWLTQGMTTDYIERSHSTAPRSYPFWGDDPLAFASSGFLWTQALRAGLSVRVYGEFSIPPPEGYPLSWKQYFQDSQAARRQLPVTSRTLVASLNGVSDSSFPAYAVNIPDALRARIFLERLQGFEENGDLPNLVILHLPADHTAGTSPAYPTPRAMMADNDLAVAKVVEAISNSSYWPRSAIFVVEDDAQDGVDHVDGHRTICLVASPYARRGVVDSTHYNQVSVLRSIEELLKIAPMNRFDAAAMAMRSAFMTQPNLRPFRALENNIQLDEMNPSPALLRGPARQAALDSMGMDFSRPDAAPEEKLNRVLWHTARGWNATYPHVAHGPACVLDDDER